MSLVSDGRFFTMEDVLREVAEWCRQHPKWKPINELTNERHYSPIPWDELPATDRRAWEMRNPYGSQSSWEEFATNKPYAHRYGHVSGAGVFYGDICDVPFGHNFCMVVEIGGPAGVYYSGGMGIRSGRRRRRRSATVKAE